MIPANWKPASNGWLRSDGLLLEVGAYFEGGARVWRGVSEDAVPKVGWNICVERGTPDGDGLDVRHPELGEDVWTGAVSGAEAMAEADARFPFAPDVAAKMPPPVRLHARKRLAPVPGAANPAGGTDG